MSEECFCGAAWETVCLIMDTKKASANNFVALQPNQTSRNLSGPVAEQGRRYLVFSFPADYLCSLG